MTQLPCQFSWRARCRVSEHSPLCWTVPALWAADTLYPRPATGSALWACRGNRGVCTQPGCRPDVLLIWHRLVHLCLCQPADDGTKRREVRLLLGFQDFRKSQFTTLKIKEHFHQEYDSLLVFKHVELDAKLLRWKGPCTLYLQGNAILIFP